MHKIHYSTSQNEQKNLKQRSQAKLMLHQALSEKANHGLLHSLRSLRYASDWLFQIGFGNILICSSSPNLISTRAKHCSGRYRQQQNRKIWYCLPHNCKIRYRPLQNPKSDINPYKTTKIQYKPLKSTCVVTYVLKNRCAGTYRPAAPGRPICACTTFFQNICNYTCWL